MYPPAPWRDISQEGKTVCWLFTPPPPWSLTLLKRFLTRYRMLHSCTHPPLGGISHRKVRQYVGSLLPPPDPSPRWRDFWLLQNATFMYPPAPWRDISQEGKTVCWLFTPPPPWPLTLLKRFLTRYGMLHSCTHPTLGGISHRKVRQYVGSLPLPHPDPSPCLRDFWPVTECYIHVPTHPLRDISQEGKTVCWLFTPPPPWPLTLLKRFLTRYRMLHSCTHLPLGGISHRKVRQYVGSLPLPHPDPSPCWRDFWPDTECYIHVPTRPLEGYLTGR